MQSNSQRTQKIRSSSQSVAASILLDETEDKNTIFWQEWQANQDYLSHCCLNWMNSNPIDAEEVLSQAMLKAWTEWQNYGSKIKCPKAWLTKIIYNFCIDLHRKRKRDAVTFQKIEDIKFEDHPVFSFRAEFPESKLLDLEMRAYLRHKIESLPARLRQPFVLHYCQEKSYPDIAKQLICSEENVRKSVRKARRILQRHLKRYLAGEDDTALNSHSPSLNLEIPLGEKSQAESNWESLMPTKTLDEEINYKVTVLCLESLPHHCYSSANPLGWR
ncbi:RNA polymerase sigma factor [Microcoleus sp.]|uniref:RNA polymerase sigma factor n=1 Tax=Microcoleus sp. TaxID=44472 RepID=UPI003524D1C5